jgi:hypothetical protein
MVPNTGTNISTGTRTVPVQKQITKKVRTKSTK